MTNIISVNLLIDRKTSSLNFCEIICVFINMFKLCDIPVFNSIWLDYNEKINRQLTTGWPQSETIRNNRLKTIHFITQGNFIVSHNLLVYCHRLIHIETRKKYECEMSLYSNALNIIAPIYYTMYVHALTVQQILELMKNCMYSYMTIYTETDCIEHAICTKILNEINELILKNDSL